jgi:Ca2+-binding EF-hand superfamily protein
MVSDTRYRVLVAYNTMKYVELKLKEKPGSRTWDIVGAKMDAPYPSEVGEGGGGGFDTGTLGQSFRGTHDGGIKAMAAFVGAEAHKHRADASESRGGKGVEGRSPKGEAEAKRTFRRLQSGRGTLYSALGTEEIDEGEYDPRASSSYAAELEDLVTSEHARSITEAFGVVAASCGVADEDDSAATGAAAPRGQGRGRVRIPQDRMGELFDIAEGIEVSEVCGKRLREFARLDADALLSLDEVLKAYNRVLNEEKQGRFYATVKELQDLFSAADADYSGVLDAAEASKVLCKVHLVTDPERVREHLRRSDLDEDGGMDFEEFLTLCRALYAERGGAVVANRATVVQFNQTRSIIDDMRERVERGRLMICHLRAQLANLEEQLEVMSSIEEHSALQRELKTARGEKKRLLLLREQMTAQHEGWCRDVRAIHGRELEQIRRRSAFMQEQNEEAEAVCAFVDEAYEHDAAEARKEAEEAAQSLGAALAFARRVERSAAEDSAAASEAMAATAGRIARFKEGRAGTPFSPDCYDSAGATRRFLQAKTSALERWLIARTQFTQQDRARYLARVEEVKAKRQEYDENRRILREQLAETQAKIGEARGTADRGEQANRRARAQLADPTERRHDEATMRALQDELDEVQKKIEVGHREKLDLSKTLFPKEHALSLERHKISLLQVELGELKVLLDDVHHHKDVEERTEHDIEEKRERAGAAKRREGQRESAGGVAFVAQ